MKKLFFLITLAIGSSALWAQEICDNQIDDDNDGFLDCYDPDCANNTACEDFYLGNDVLCEVVPSEFPQFTMTLDFASPNESTNHIGRMSIGDIDRDGIPEIVTMNRYTNRLIILNGNDGSVKESVGVNFTPLWEIALGNLDDDNCAELFFQGIRNGDLYLYAYDCNLNQIWSRRIWDDGNWSANDAIMYGLADFDGDGLVELYVKDMILDAHTGTIIINTDATTDNQWRRINGGPTAVDIMGNTNLELVSGCRIYDINLGARTANSGTKTLLASLPEYEVKHEYNATSVADYNQDGNLDVIASGGLRINGDLYTTIFFWDVTNNTYRTFNDPIAGNFTIDGCPPETGQYYRFGWRDGTGRINIGDLDGDERLDISYVSGKFLYALDENLDLLWRITINEETSGYTGCTLFDFNGDGISEIVYRDERYLYIIRGTDGNIFSQQACISRTNREYPIVADVDADGSTELCVTCGFDDAASAANFCDLNYARYSHVRVFKSAAEPWVPARRLWNQHGYFNVNVNDDLTIPRNQQKHHLVWSTGNCTQGPNRPLNNFLNQSPFLNSQGCPTYAAPDLAMVPGSLQIDHPTCPETDFTVSFQFQNLGDVAVSGDVPVTFYRSDPFQAGAVRLNTATITLNNFAVGATYNATNITVNGNGSAFELWAVLNDPGTSAIPMTWPLADSPIVECPNDNNTDFENVVPLPVSITALKVSDNIKCVGSSTPDNGAVRAFIPVGGTENIADYNFYWSIGTTAKPVASADFVGPTINNLADGTYTVYAIHKTANCNSDTTSVVVDRINNVVTANIILQNGLTNCTNPDGSLRVEVNGGEPINNFTYEWYEGNDIFTGIQVGVSHIATNLKAITYTVLVTEIATGCPDIRSFTVPDETVRPVVSVTTIAPSCLPGATGSLSASVNGVTAGFTFKWYNGNTVKPTPDFTGITYNNRPTGNYTVVAENNTSLCSSLPHTENLTVTTPPAVNATTIANQTSCDSSQPNGSVSADVGGQTTGFSFEWFTGQNTQAVNLVASTPTASGLAAGVYTVRATDDVTGCSATREVTIANNVVTPNIIVGATANSTNCTTPNGSVTVNVSLDAPSDYTFFWYDGDAVKVTPDYVDTDNVLDGLVPGEYTVRAVHNTKHCETLPVTATVMDDAPPISIIVNDLVTQLPSDCGANNGQMTVNLSAPGNVGGFDVSWYIGVEPFVDPPILQQTGVTTSTASNLASALYSVVAVNRDNGCQRIATFDLPFANAHFLNFVDKLDVNRCSPTNIGQIEVELLPAAEPPGVFNESDYDIHLYTGTVDGMLPLGSPVGGSLLQVIPGMAGESNYLTINTLDPGMYTLVAIAKNSLVPPCRTPALVVEIEQITEDPVIVASLIDPNTNCVSAGNGSIELNIDNGANPADYTITWYEGPDTSAPTLGTGTSGTTNAPFDIASDLPPGFYTVEVINNTAVNTACSSTATFRVLDNPPVVSATTIASPLTRCDTDDGSAEVTEIFENGVSIPLVNYTFEWFDNTMTPTGGILPTLTNLAPGEYFARGTNSLNGCATTLLAFTIDDMTINSVGVDLMSFTEPTRCLNPNVDGELVVEGTGNSTSGYSYNWYAGAAVGAPGSEIETTATLSGITIPPGDPDITFTVEVINNTNQCRISDTYVLPLNIAPVNLAASAAPVTFCDPDNNGSTFATVTTGLSTNYQYNWSIGSVSNSPADYTGNIVSNLIAGEYTVVAVDLNDAFCESNAVTVTVGLEQQMPMVTAMGQSPVTNCDPTIPNGTATASVGGNITNYFFDWFTGTTASGTPFYSGPDVNSLEANTYTVRATHMVTGCFSTAQVEIMYEPASIPDVEIELLSNVTSCISPNGILTASVGGNKLDYTFSWNIGSVSNLASPDFIGHTWDSLEVGTYTVVATNNATGCTTAPDTEVIIEDLSFPDFDFTVVNSMCSEDANGDGSPDDQPSGQLSLVMKNFVDIASIVWDRNGEPVREPAIFGLEAGTYSVTVTSRLGCETTKEVTVGSEIRPYNGISRNGDGRNDRFHINCIEDFPNNVVQIFNRAGTLVAQYEGYDNIDIYFDGKSNKGISVMGNNLPDGTYFYVIDKRNGSKPVAGYLEIVN